MQAIRSPHNPTQGDQRMGSPKDRDRKRERDPRDRRGDNRDWQRDGREGIRGRRESVQGRGQDREGGRIRERNREADGVKTEAESVGIMASPREASAIAPAVSIYSLDKYKIGKKPPLRDKWKDQPQMMQFRRMEENFMRLGMRRSVEGILLVHRQGLPHLLLLQKGPRYVLPGGRLRPGEAELEGLSRKLNNKLGVTTTGAPMEWEIGEMLAMWWRPGFEKFTFPFLPPRCEKPKECKKVFLVMLPDNCKFAVPENLRLVAVPFSQLWDNPMRFGALIASIPQLVSRFKFNQC